MNERGDNADTEFRPDIQDRAFVGDDFKHVAHVVEAQTVFRHDVPKAALVVGRASMPLGSG